MNEFGQEHLDALTHRVQFGGDEVVNAKVYSIFFLARSRKCNISNGLCCSIIYR